MFGTPSLGVNLLFFFEKKKRFHHCNLSYMLFYLKNYASLLFTTTLWCTSYLQLSDVSALVNGTLRDFHWINLATVNLYMERERMFHSLH
jgi:hypothetical protein